MLVYIVSVDLRIRPDTVLVVLDHNMFLTLVPNQERMVLGITLSEGVPQQSIMY